MFDFNELIKMYIYYMEEAENIFYLEDECSLAYHKHCLWVADNYKRWLELLS